MSKSIELEGKFYDAIQMICITDEDVIICKEYFSSMTVENLIDYALEEW